MRVLITGSSGKVGRVVAAHLAASGHEVFGVDAQAPKVGGGPRLHRCDLRDPFAIHRAIDAAGWVPDTVCHLANLPHAGVAPAERVLRENLSINSGVFMGAFDQGVKRIVFTSSIQAVIGGVEREFRADAGRVPLPSRLPIDESMEATPTNAYGLSKILSERMLAGLVAMDAGRSGVSLRLPFVMSAAAFDHHVAGEWAKNLAWGMTEAFAYVHERDAAEAFRASVEAPLEGCEPLWIVAPDPRPPNPVESIVREVYADVPGAEAAIALGGFYDTSRAERVLGWRAEWVLRAARERAKV